MSFDLYTIFSEMGVFAMLIVAALALMAVSSLAVFVERVWAFRRTRKKSLRFSAVAAKYLDAGNFAALVTAAKEKSERGNPLAELLGAGARTYTTARKKPGKVPPIELTRRDMARKADAISARLRRGLGVVASVGSTAPFVGLLGTVVGIIDAFKGIAASGSGGIGSVSSGIAEALVVTAIGLVVAIPAVLLFNYLSGKSDALELALDQARGEFVDYVEASETDDNETDNAEPSFETQANAAA